MRFFASWWERVPKREVGPTLAGAVIALGAVGFLHHFIQRVFGAVWG